MLKVSLRRRRRPVLVFDIWLVVLLRSVRKVVEESRGKAVNTAVLVKIGTPRKRTERSICAKGFNCGVDKHLFDPREGLVVVGKGISKAA